MLEILQNFESTVGEAARLRPVVIAGTGAAVVGVGLCVWLGGLSLRKPLVAIAGAIIGGILGLVLIGRGVIALTGSALAAAVLARVFERVFIVVMGAALAAFIAFAVLAGPYVESPRATGAAASAGAPGESSAGIEELMAYAIDAGARIKQAAWLMPVQKLAIIVLAGVLFLAAGFVFWRPTAALCFSVAGTILIFAGMITLLVCKGAAPVSQISSRPLAYAGVFAAMTLFGTVEQLLLCRGAKTPAAPPEKPKGRSRRA
jgi:hypothetical protein